MLLSSMAPLLGTTIDDNKKKTAIYKTYDFTKGVTDIVDQRIGTYRVSTKNRRLTFTTLCYILDTSRVNAGSVYQMNKGLNQQKN